MLLKVSHLSVLIKGANPDPLFSDVNFNMPSGSIFTIAGKNGSGKTTLIKAITGLLNKDKFTTNGQVLFKNSPLFIMPENEIMEIRRTKIKYVFQDAVNSFNPLVKLDYYFKNFPGDDNSADELLDYFFLPSLKKIKLLHSYELSGGMVQRIAIVLSLRAQPDLLILDEPTSSLDSPIVNLLLNKLQEYTSGGEKSVLIVTQDLPFARAASTCAAVLKDGVLSRFYDRSSSVSDYSAGNIFIKDSLQS